MGIGASIIESTSGFIGHYWRSAVVRRPSPIDPLIRAIAPSPPQTPSDVTAAELAQLVQTEIVPRLVLAHQIAPQAAGIANLAEAAAVFTELVLSREVDALMTFIDDLLEAGASLDALHRDLLAPTAMRLGDYWNEDRISFTDVTIAVGRLQHLVRTLSSRRDQAAEEEPDRTAYFIPSVSEQHTFGLFILEDIFQRAGWRTWIEANATDNQTVAAVRCQWFDLLGISASRENQIGEIAATIAAARRASRNPDLFILVGGRLFIEQPEIVSTVGADALASSGDHALLVADELFVRRG